jgi:hypothetical protein
MRLLSLLMVAALLGCGGSAPAAGSTTASTSGDDSSSTGHRHRRRRRASSDAHADATSDDDSGDTADEFPLDERVDVPGTGVSMQAPRGSDLAPVGAGFIHTRRRIQILVAVAHGTDENLQGFIGSLSAGAEEVESEDVTIGGHAAHLVIDTQENGEVELERVWILMREGDSAMAVVGAYTSDRSERLRGLVRASVLSTEWDASATIEPERAVGFHLTAPDGLVPEPQVVNTLTYAAPGASMSPASGRPAMLLVPLPIQVPAAQRDDYCEQILLQAGPVSEDTVVSRAEIETDTVQGCEVFGTQEIPDPVEGGPSELATYAAIVFIDEASFMVAGFVDVADRDTWSPRFSAAARTVGAVARE